MRSMSLLVRWGGLARYSMAVVVCALVVASGLAGGLQIATGYAHSPAPRSDAGTLPTSSVPPGQGLALRPTPALVRPDAAQPMATGAYVSRTLVLYNDTVVPGNFQPGNGEEPTGIAYEPSNGLIYVVDLIDDNVSVVNPATDEVVATIPTGSALGGIVYDSGTNQVVVADLYPDELTFIDPATNSAVSTLPIPDGAYSLAYDSSMNELFVTAYIDGNVTVVDDATDTIVTTIPVGGQPTSIAFDATLGELFVANSYSSSYNVSVISDTSNSVIANISLGATPYSVLFDPVNQDLYVANLYNVS